MRAPPLLTPDYTGSIKGLSSGLETSIAVETVSSVRCFLIEEYGLSFDEALSLFRVSDSSNDFEFVCPYDTGLMSFMLRLV